MWTRHSESGDRVFYTTLESGILRRRGDDRFDAFPGGPREAWARQYARLNGLAEDEETGEDELPEEAELLEDDSMMEDENSEDDSAGDQDVMGDELTGKQISGSEEDSQAEDETL